MSPPFSCGHLPSRYWNCIAVQQLYVVPLLTFWPHWSDKLGGSVIRGILTPPSISKEPIAAIHKKVHAWHGPANARRPRTASFCAPMSRLHG